jgi:carbon storage regulator
MLILSRKLNESIIIDGKIVVKVLRIDKDTVKLGIQAPAELPVHREEIHEAIQRSKGQNGGAAPGVKPSSPAAPRTDKTLPETEQKK